MALRRRRLKNINGSQKDVPVRCYFCKEVKALTSIHGGLVGSMRGYGGKKCCDKCFQKVKAEEEELQSRNGNAELSEGERQAFGHLIK